MKNCEERNRQFEEQEEQKRQRRVEKENEKFAKKLDAEFGEADRKRQMEEEKEDNKRARMRAEGACIPGSSGGANGN